MDQQVLSGQIMGTAGRRMGRGQASGIRVANDPIKKKTIRKLKQKQNPQHKP